MKGISSEHFAPSYKNSVWGSESLRERTETCWDGAVFPNGKTSLSQVNKVRNRSTSGPVCEWCRYIKAFIAAIFRRVLFGTGSANGKRKNAGRGEEEKEQY